MPLDEQGRPLDDCAVLDELVIDGMRRQRRIRTRHGGLVSFQGNPPPFQRPEAFDPGWSSNSLSMMRLGGAPHVHKRYRIVSSGIHEPEILVCARGADCLPEYAGDYAYVSRYGDRYPLGVVYRYVAGEPLESLLRGNFWTLWTVLSTGGTVAGHVNQLGGVLRAVGALIRRLHLTLASNVAPVAAAFEAAPCVGRTRELLRNVMSDLLSDADHLGGVRRAIADTLTRAVFTAPVTLTEWGAGGICHGDLHLSHLICQGKPDGSWTVRAIDVSSSAIDPHDPDFAHQSPWQDLVAVQRGLEAFAAHEAARVLGADRRETCRVAVHDACGTPDPLAGPAEAHETRSRLFGAADAWSAAALRLILDGYRVSVSTEHPLWRLLYLRRLLHELGYNYAHRRKYQVNVDLRYAARLGR